MDRNEDFMVADWQVQPQLNRLLLLGETTPLEPKVMEVLLCLAEEAPRVVTKKDLLDRVWRGAFVTDEVLTNAVWELRRALGDKAKNPQFVETIRGRGYRLLVPPAPVCQEADSSKAPASDRPDETPLGQHGARQRWRFAGLSLLACSVLVCLLWWSSSFTAESPSRVPPSPEAPGPEAPGPEVQALVSQGRFFLSQASKADREKARLSFAAAVAQDPSYAPAYAGLADSYILQPGKGTLGILPATREAAKAAALRAVELDDELAAAHLARARVAGPLEWDWPQAEESLLRALQLEPENERALLLYSTFLSAMGRPEAALEKIQTLLEDNPSSPRLRRQKVHLLYLSGSFERAAQEAQRLLAVQPSSRQTRILLALNYLELGRERQALREIRSLLPATSHAGEIGYALARLGHRDQASRLLEKQTASQDSSGYPAALILTGLGQKLAALDWLEFVVNQHHPNAWRLASDPSLRSLTTEPRFQKLLKRLGLTSMQASSTPS
ncbi:MAG: winged helix-turn-helix domain-containing protein [Deltaproteobacteria bacterium]|nr:winged helix-turn-helix domain-containing protein [Deltaproteobacteria bacterium]